MTWGPWVERFIFDPETGSILWREIPVGGAGSVHERNRWNTRYAGREFGAVNSRGYRSGRINGRSVQAHRLAWFLHYGKAPEGEIDHINGIKTDNRIANLRDIPHSVNTRNAKRRRDNTSGVTGVKRSGTAWVAKVGPVYLGSFSTLEAAAAARASAAAQAGFTRRHGSSKP